MGAFVRSMVTLQTEQRMSIEEAISKLKAAGYIVIIREVPMSLRSGKRVINTMVEVYNKGESEPLITLEDAFSPGYIQADDTGFDEEVDPVIELLGLVPLG